MWTLAVVQDNFNQGDIQHNLQLMEKHVETCVETYPDTRLILFPELATTGYVLSEQLLNKAEYAEGPTFASLSELARKHGRYIGYGFVEKVDEGVSPSIYNSMNLIAPDGSRIATYQKMHLTPLEAHLFTPGRRLVTVDTELGRFGLLICWDMAFPELSRLLALEGADVLLVPSAWEVPHDWSYRQTATARALDNTVYVATCNHTGRAGELHFFGQSAIYRPDGQVLNEAETEDHHIVVAEIDLNVGKQLQDDFYSMWRDRRGDLYHLQWNGKRIRRGK